MLSGLVSGFTAKVLKMGDDFGNNPPWNAQQQRKWKSQSLGKKFSEKRIRVHLEDPSLMDLVEQYGNVNPMWGVVFNAFKLGRGFNPFADQWEWPIYEEDGDEENFGGGVKGESKQGSSRGRGRGRGSVRGRSSSGKRGGSPWHTRAGIKAAVEENKKRRPKRKVKVRETR